LKILLPEGGDVFYIQGPPSTSSAKRRFAGAQLELVGTRIKMEVLDADWSIEGGAEAARGWLRILRDRDLSRCVVSAQNDSMVIGARSTLATGLGVSRKHFAALRFTGCDGAPAYGQRLVLEKQLTATVDIPPTAGRAVEIIAAVLNGARPPTSDERMEVASFPEFPTLLKGRRERGKGIDDEGAIRSIAERDILPPGRDPER
jgi:ribose transport system substrate-binding protein